MTIISNLAAGALWLAVLLGGQLGVGYSLIQENDHLARARVQDAEACRRGAPQLVGDSDYQVDCLAVPHAQLNKWLRDTHAYIEAACRMQNASYQDCMRDMYPLERANAPKQ
jgi:hypothetical protein